MIYQYIAILFGTESYVIVVIIMRTIAAKKTAKKVPKAAPKRGADKKKKLPRGYKECGNCKKLLHIHKYTCDACGFRHDMKKKKVDILKNLNKVTPKLLRSLIELNDFNDLSHLQAQPPLYSDLSLLKS